MTIVRGIFPKMPITYLGLLIALGAKGTFKKHIFFRTKPIFTLLKLKKKPIQSQTNPISAHINANSPQNLCNLDKLLHSTLVQPELWTPIIPPPE